MINIIQNTIGALGRTLGIVRKNLQLWLDFEKSEWVGGELVVKDRSPNTNNAKLFTGKALSFNGNDSVDLGSQSNSGSELTLAAWIEPTDLTGVKAIFAFGDSLIRINGDDINVFADVGNAPATFSDVITTNKTRVVVTISGTNVSLYINDSLIDTKTVTNPLSSDSRASYIGRYSNETSYFNGLIADVQLYNKAWDSDDVAFDYNNPNHLAIDNPDTGLVVTDLKGYWAMSEGDGLVAYDSSGEGKNGTINGATYTPAQDTIPQLGMMDWAKSTPVADEVTLIQAPNNKGYDILGNALRLREHAFNLDGSGYGEVADDDSLDMNEGFSVSFWRKLDVSTDGVRSALVTKGVGLSTGTDYGVALSMYTTNNIYGDINTDLGRTFVQKSLTIDGSWVFVTFTYTKNEKSRLYIDTDAPIVSTTISGTINESHPITIGTDKDLGFKDSSLIDEVVWYDRPLTQKEITQNYKQGINKHKALSSFSDDFSSDYGI